MLVLGITGLVLVVVFSWFGFCGGYADFADFGCFKVCPMMDLLGWWILLSWLLFGFVWVVCVGANLFRFRVYAGFVR